MPGDSGLDPERLIAIGSTIGALLLGAVALFYRVRGDDDEAHARTRMVVIDEADRMIQWNRQQAQDAIDSADRLVEHNARLLRQLDECHEAIREAGLR